MTPETQAYNYFQIGDSIKKRGLRRHVQNIYQPERRDHQEKQNSMRSLQYQC